ncbi:patatin-like phospholipase family protein [Chitinophaga arvensicola]|uniref:Patatin-like phospholipase n=1 Tax=Chitinophaga arvensicola TaxID=29529 RepID=A0A1I0QSG8_9BACT|nr:patatin-like phospholipase family protein [Chitinophaga arvensicola]SEW30509.1 Patatin-like phospholipase [Chitinophaga arvensicola]
MATTALVISGGGSRAAFAVGALKYLYSQHPDINFDFFCGTGISALIAPLAALGEINLLEKLFTSNTTADIISTSSMLQRFPQSNSLYNATALSHKVTNIFTDQRFRALQQLNKEVFVAGRCLQNSRVTYFSPASTDMVKKDYDVISLHDNYTFREAVLASCSMPVFMPPVEVASLPDQVQQFSDGGGASYHPVQLAIEKGATDVYVILTTPEVAGQHDIVFKNLLDILEKEVDQHHNGIAATELQSTHLLNHTLTYLDAVKEKMKQAGVPAATIDDYFDVPAGAFLQGKRMVNLHVIRPKHELDVHMGGLEFIPQVMQEMMAAGEEQAREVLHSSS